MKKIFCMILFLLMLNSIAFAGIEIPEYIKVQMADGSILEIELDNYLYGVVQNEIGVNYKSADMKESAPVPMEALKAQAVASRSYAVYNILNTGEDAKYHVTSTTSSQVYKEVNVNPNIKAAVDETTGQVILYDDEVACAYFFSTSGGQTEAPENVWTAEVPYLKGVEDEYEIEVDNKTTWTATYTNTELMNKFPDIGEIEDVDIVRRSENDRVIELRIEGDKATKILLKNGIRTSLGSTKLKSQWFDVEVEDNKVIFDGRGYGHGIGMSQNGAIGMALNDFTYDEILKWYYTDIEILGFEEDDYKNKDDDEEYDTTIEDDELEDEEEKIEISKPLLEKLIKICNTNLLLEYIKA